MPLRIKSAVRTDGPALARYCCSSLADRKTEGLRLHEYLRQLHEEAAHAIGASPSRAWPTSTMGKRKAKVEVDSFGKKRIKVTVQNVAEAEASFNLSGSCMSTPVRRLKGLKALRSSPRTKGAAPSEPSKASAGKICSVITIDDNDNEEAEAFRTIDVTGQPDPGHEPVATTSASVTELVEENLPSASDVVITAEVPVPKPTEQEVIFLTEKSKKTFGFKRITALFKKSDKKAEPKGYPFNPNQEVNTNFTQTSSNAPFRFLAHRPPPASTAAMRKGTSDRIDRLASKRRQHSMTNVFVSPSLDDSSNQRQLRPIAIDGSNVAFEHGNAAFGKRVFSCGGILKCFEYFKAKGHEEIMVFVPQNRQGGSVDTRNIEIFEKLKKSGNMVFTPTRQIQGTHVASYDDRYIVQWAAVKDAVIVSNDKYRDLLGESQSMRRAIEERRLPFNFIGKDVLMFPDDPLGQRGPTLNEFLSF